MASTWPHARRREVVLRPAPDALPRFVHQLLVELVEQWDTLSDASRLTIVRAIERAASQLDGEDGRSVFGIAPTVIPELTDREIDVLRALAAGGTTASAAEALFISESTVRSHVKNILGKLGMHSRTEAVAWAIQRHVISPVEFR